MILYSIDPGITRTAVAVFRLELVQPPSPGDSYGMAGAARGLLDVCTIAPPVRLSHPERYAYLGMGLGELLEKWMEKERKAVIEIPSYAGQYRQRRTTKHSIEILNRAIGAIEAALGIEKIAVTEIEAEKAPKEKRLLVVNESMKAAGCVDVIDQADSADAVYQGLCYITRNGRSKNG